MTSALKTVRDRVAARREQHQARRSVSSRALCVAMVSAIAFSGLALTTVVVAPPAGASQLPALAQLGMPPVVTFNPGSSVANSPCSVYGEGPPDCLYATYYGYITVLPHVVGPNQDITATAHDELGGKVSWGQVPGTVTGGCFPGAGSCSFLPDPSPYPPRDVWRGNWDAYTATFCGFFGCAPSADYYYASSQPTISGTILDSSGTPPANATISITGAQNLQPQYDPTNGSFTAIVQPGQYSVTATDGGTTDSLSLCSGTSNGNACTVKLNAGQASYANFADDTQASISGQVTDTNGNAEPDVTMSLTNTACYDNSTACTSPTVTTDAAGNYSTDVLPGQYTVAPTGLATGLRSDPGSRIAFLQDHAQSTDNFTLTHGPVVSMVSPPSGSAAGGDTITVSGAGFGAQGSADTVMVCPQALACQAGLNPVVQDDGTLTFTTPNMLSEANSSTPLYTDVVVTDSTSRTSLKSTNDGYYFGCKTNQNLPDGSWTAGSCFNEVGQTGQYDASMDVNLDGAKLPSASGSNVVVDTSSQDYTSSSATNLQLNLGPQQLVTLITGITNINLNQPSFTLKAAAGATMAGFPVMGNVTFATQGSGSMTVTVNVKLPTILGGAMGTLVATSTQGQGVTSMNITVASAQPQNVAHLFGLSNLALSWTRSSNTWTVSAAGAATGSPFTLNGNLTYGASGGLTSGMLNLTGAISLGGGVITLKNVNLTYNSGAWTASATVMQATGTLMFSIAVDTNGNVTSGSVMSASPISLFGVVTLQTFDMEYTGTQWTLAVTAGPGGNNKCGVQVDTNGVVQGFNLNLQNVTLEGAITLNSLDISYSTTGGHKVYTGSVNASLPGSSASFGGTITFTDGAFTSGKVFFSNGPRIPIGTSGVFIVGGDAGLSLSPVVELTGGVDLEFGPAVGSSSAFGAHVQLTYDFASGGTTPTPGQVTLAGEFAAGGVPGSKHTVSLGNGDLTINGNAQATFCVALGSPSSPGGCQGGGSLSIGLGAKVSGQLSGAVSSTTAYLDGTGGLTSPISVLNFTGIVTINPYGVAVCKADKSDGYSYKWGGSLPTRGCPSSWFNVPPAIQSASAGGGDPTTGLDVVAGTNASVTASGFLSGETVTATLDSSGETVGSGTADTNGNVSIVAAIPLDAQYGANGLIFAGSTSTQSVDLPLMVTNGNPTGTANIEILGPSTVDEGTEYDAAALADGSPAPTYALQGAPSWLSIDTNSGAISGTDPTTSDTTFTYSVVASNTTGGHATSPVQTITIVPDVAPTSASVNGPSSVTDGDNYMAETVAPGTPSSTYAFASSPAAPSWLSVDPSSGLIFGTQPNDGSTSFSYAVVATNSVGSATTPTTTVDVTAPTAPTTVTVTSPANIVATSFFDATSQADGGPAPTFAFASSPTPPSWLSIDPATGEVTGTPPSAGSFSFAVVATNDSGSATSATSDVTVIAPTAPTSVVVSGPSTLAAGDGYDATVTADGAPAATLSFASSPAAPSWLSIDPTTGEVTGAEPPFGPVTFSFAVVATNASGSATSATTTVTVDTAPMFTSSTPSSTVDPGGTYQYQFAAFGLPDAATYSLDADAPSWLSINPTTGQLSGTEPNNGESSFVYSVLATNSEGTTTAGPFAVTVIVAPTFTAGSPPLVADAGQIYTYPFAATGDVGGTTFTIIDTTATWLSMDPQTGVLTGTEPGNFEPSFTYSVQANDDGGSTIVGPFTVKVDQAPVFSQDAPPLIAAAGGFYESQFTAISLPDAPTYALGAGAPSWLSIDPTSGQLSGTEPNNGETSFSYSVVATNSQGSTTSGPFTVTVETIPAFPAESPPLSVAAGASYNYDFTAFDPAGSSGGPTFSLVAAPSWLSIDPATGAVSGTEPNNDESTFSYSVQATNNTGSNEVGPYTVSVDLAPTFTKANPTQWLGPDYTSYDYTFHANATPDAPVYSLGGGAPSWLSIDPAAGTVTGTEPNGGQAPFTYSVTATNSQGSTTVGPYTVGFGIPTVTSVYDESTQQVGGQVSGGDVVQVNGTDLAGASDVTMQAASCTGSLSGYTLGQATPTSVNSAGTQLTFVAPDVNTSGFYAAHDYCVDRSIGVDVRVVGGQYNNSTNPNIPNLTSKLSATSSADEMGYGNPVDSGPTVASVVDTSSGVSSGPLGGGEQLTITGTGFNYATSVSFNDASCTDDAGSITATVPVTQSEVSSNGTVLTLTSPSEIADWQNACSSSALTTDITVSNALPPTGITGQSAINPSTDQFTFTPPEVDAVLDTTTSSTSGTVAGGDTLTITGSGFTGASQVAFSDAACTADQGSTSATVSAPNLTVNTEGTQLTLTTPSEVSDFSNACSDNLLTTDVVVTVLDAASSTTVSSPINAPADQYSFGDFANVNVTSVDDTTTGQPSGSLFGGDALTIMGSGFQGATQVAFEDAACTGDPGTTSVTLDASQFIVSPGGTSITLTSPGDAADWQNACAGGLVTTDVVVTIADPITGNPIQSAVNAPQDQFSFVGPNVTAVVDTSTDNPGAPIVGGDTIEVTGTGLQHASLVSFVPSACSEPGEQTLTIAASKLTVSPDGTTVSFTNPGDLHAYADGCSGIAVLNDVLVTVTDPATSDTVTSADSSGDGFGFSLPYVDPITVSATGSTTAPIAGGGTAVANGFGFTGVYQLQFFWHGHLGATRAVTPTNDGLISFTVPDLTSLAADVTAGQGALNVDVVADIHDPYAPGGFFSSVVQPADLLSARLATVTGVTAASTHLGSGPLAGGEVLNVAGTGLHNAVAIAFHYARAGHPTVTFTAPVTSVNTAGTLATVVAPDAQQQIGLTNGITLATGQTSVVTSIQASETDTATHVQYASATNAEGVFSFLVPANHAPSITSPATALAVVGKAFSETITTSGWPNPSITLASHPSWLTFKDNHNGTATISGTPTAHGTATLSFSATNGVGTTATLKLHLTIDTLPAFTGVTSTSVKVHTHFSVTVKTTASPTAKVTASGLPTGITAKSNSNGSVTISGTPTVTGTITITLKATNAAGKVTESFKVLVHT